jgi:hypothetical protein
MHVTWLYATLQQVLPPELVLTEESHKLRKEAWIWPDGCTGVVRISKDSDVRVGGGREEGGMVTDWKYRADHETCLQSDSVN